MKGSCSLYIIPAWVSKRHCERNEVSVAISGSLTRLPRRFAPRNDVKIKTINK
ncbi:MAG: hypothetical protein AB8U97_00030 [Rickettsia endosymbiont of Haemaphysalis japonica]